MIVEADSAVLIDVDLVEERLVEDPSVVVVGLAVGGVAVPGEVEAGDEVCARGVVILLRAGQLALYPGELNSDAVLLVLEQVEGYGAGVVSFEQFLPSCDQLDALLCETCVLLGRGGVKGVEVSIDVGFEAVSKLGAQRNGSVLLLDELLDGFDDHGLAGAVSAFGVAAGADEVGVGGAGAVLAVGQDQSAAARAAVDGSFEVVVVLSLVGAGLIVRGQAVLHLLPRDGVDQRLVLPGVLDPSVDKLTFVVRVA